jgi:hypothetical protein
MKRILEFARAIFISPEFLVLLAGILLVTFGEILLNSMLSRLNGMEAIKYLAAFPVAVLVLSFKDANQLLFPSEEKMDLLSGWQNYWRFKIVVIAACIWAVVYACLAVCSWVFGNPDKSSYALAVLLTSIVGSGVTYWSVFNARIKIREILKGRNS